MKKLFPLLLIPVLFFNCQLKAQPGQWSYLPQQNYLGTVDGFSDITFGDSITGFANSLSYRGDLLKTANGGQTWNILRTPVSPKIMHFQDGLVGWISDGVVLAKTTDGGNSWSNLLTINSGNTISDFIFIDQLNGFFAGNGCIGKTTDGGNTWVYMTPGNIRNSWNKIQFLNIDTGWVYGSDTLIAKTIDGGLTWTQQILPVTDYMLNGHFFTADSGVVISTGGVVYQSYDGGNNWVTTYPFSGNPNAIKFGPGNLTYVISYNSQVFSLYYSLNNGNTWIIDTVPGEGAICFVPPSTLYSGGKQIFKTSNWGVTWQSQTQIYYGLGDYITDIDFLSNMNFIAGSDNSFSFLGSYTTIESFDDGNSFTENYTSPYALIDVISDTCYFVGPNSVRYDNGVPTNLNKTVIYAKSRDSIIADGPNVSRSIDGGLTWTNIFISPDSVGILGEWYGKGASAFNGDYYSEFVSWDTGMVAYTIDTGRTSAEFLTTDGGLNWFTFPVHRYDFIVGLKRSPSGELYSVRTDFYGCGLYKLNSNMSWQFMSQLDFIAGVEAFVDFGWSPDGLLWSCVNGYLAYSTDGGLTWGSTSLNSNDITCFKMTHVGKFVAGTEFGDILEYNAHLYNCQIRGNVFYDYNLNGIKDGYDNDAVAYPVNTAPWSLKSFTRFDGSYNVNVDSGNYIVYADTLCNYRLVPVQHSVSFISQTGLSTGNDFALQPRDTSIRDLYVGIFEGCQSAPGFNHTTYLTCANVGVQPLQPTIMLIMDSMLTFTSADVTASAQHSDTIIWILPVLNPMKCSTITVQLALSANAQLGQILKNMLIGLPLIGDNNPSDNIDSSDLRVLGSFDPNFKTVRQTGIPQNQVHAQSKLQYTINFQNTGSDSTHFILVKDVLDARLNLATIRLIASSNPCDYHIENGNTLVFRFANIQLPDSATDQEHSHGFVSFLIEPKAELLGTDTILNSADIYFDYNNPVSTNNAKTVVENQIATIIQPVYGLADVKIFPNPASDIIHVMAEKDFECTMYDISGRQILTSKSFLGQLTLSVNNLAGGMYLLKIEKDGKMQGYQVCVLRN